MGWLNRIELQTDAMAPGNKTVTVYDDTNRQTTITLANNLVNISTYDQAGRLLSVKRMDGSLDLGTTSYTYDKLGRLSMVTSPTSEKSFTLYDAASRKVGEIDAEGALTQFIYNQDNQLVQTQRWAKKVSGSSLAALALDPSSGALPANLLSNAMAGWTMGVDGAAAGFSTGVDFNPDWKLAGEATPYIKQTGFEATSPYLIGPAVSVSVGKTYEVSAYTGAHRATVSLEVEFYGPGRKLLEDEASAQTQDFIMINHPVFFVRNASDYVGFQRAIDGGTLRSVGWFVGHLFHETRIALAIRNKEVSNSLNARYWSMTPSKLGTEQMKFSAMPCVGGTFAEASASRDRLRDNLQDQLASKAACFDFMLQTRDSPDEMPIEDPTVEWDEQSAPFTKVARIDITPQTPEQGEACEVRSFSPWHAIEAHRPLRGISRVRKDVYQAISTLRHRLNGQPRSEPGSKVD